MSDNSIFSEPSDFCISSGGPFGPPSGCTRPAAAAPDILYHQAQCGNRYLPLDTRRLVSVSDSFLQTTTRACLGLSLHAPPLLQVPQRCTEEAGGVGRHGNAVIDWLVMQHSCKQEMGGWLRIGWRHTPQPPSTKDLLGPRGSAQWQLGVGSTDNVEGTRRHPDKTGRTKVQCTGLDRTGYPLARASGWRCHWALGACWANDFLLLPNFQRNPSQPIFSFESQFKRPERLLEWPGSWEIV